MSAQAVSRSVRGDNYYLKSHKYVCITNNQPDTKSNPNPTTKQHAIVSIQLNIVACPTYPEKFIRDNVVAPSVRLWVVIVALPFRFQIGRSVAVTYRRRWSCRTAQLNELLLFAESSRPSLCSVRYVRRHRLARLALTIMRLFRRRPTRWQNTARLNFSGNHFARSPWLRMPASRCSSVPRTPNPHRTL